MSVVPNIQRKRPGRPGEFEGLGGDTYLVVSNRTDWLNYFSDEHILSFEGKEKAVDRQLRKDREEQRRAREQRERERKEREAAKAQREREAADEENDRSDRLD